MFLQSVARCAGCFCPSYPGGAKCWSLSFSPKHLRWYEVSVVVSSCSSACGDSPFITATVARGAWREFGTQPVIMGKSPDDGCDCSALVCEVKNYTVPATWTAALEFCSADCGEGSGAPGAWRIVSSTGLYSIASVPLAACGPPGFTGIRIVFRGTPPVQTLTSCGNSAVMERAFGHNSAPMSEVALTYCIRPDTNGCVLDLYSVEIGGAAYSYSEGIGASPDDCICDPGLGSNLVETLTGTTGNAIEYAASGWGSVYALAGSPPASITCRSCAG